jgi:hypothetical protein
MAIFNEWARLSARIRGLVKATELAASLFETNNDSLGAMVGFGEDGRRNFRRPGNLSRPSWPLKP